MPPPKPQLAQRIACHLLSARIGLPFVIVLLVLSAVLGYRQSRLTGVTDIGPPFDLETYGHIDIDPAENAASDYEAAEKLLVSNPKAEVEDLDLVLEGGWHRATPDVKRWLQDNQAALDQWRIGTDKHQYLRIQLADLTLDNSVVSVSDSRTFMRLSRVAAARALDDGMPNDAWRWYRALFRFSRHTGMHGSVIDRLVGAGFHSAATEDIVRWAGNDSTTTSQIMTALADIRSDYLMTGPRSANIRAEYITENDQLHRLDEVREFLNEFAFSQISPPSPPEMFFANEPELTERLLRHQVANLLRFVDLPREERPPMIPGDFIYFDAMPSESDGFLPPAEFQAAVERSLLAKLTLLGSGLNRSIRREQTRQALLETALAAEWYRREQGEFPQRIEQLVDSGILSSIPFDPMSAPGDSILYQRDADDPQAAKIWSVGEDGFDDGGDLERVPYSGPPDTGYVIGHAAQ